MELLDQRARIFLCIFIHILQTGDSKFIFTSETHKSSPFPSPSITVFIFTNLKGENQSLKDVSCAFLLQNFTSYWQDLFFSNDLFLLFKSTVESLGVGPRTAF